MLSFRHAIPKVGAGSPRGKAGTAVGRKRNATGAERPRRLPSPAQGNSLQRDPAATPPQLPNPTSKTRSRNRMIDRERIAATRERIAPFVRRTPVLEADGADFGLPPLPLILKLESLQHSGSFKARGAFANLLGRDLPAVGVAAASGGNHGAAVAFAARRLGVPARIFVPSISSPAKVERIRGYGAELVVGGDRYADALEASERWAAGSGALPVHAYDQEETLLGQGTLGAELEEQAPGLHTLLVAVGGGGLIGGIAGWYAGRLRIVGVEPERAPTLARALEAGRPMDVEVAGVAGRLARRAARGIADVPPRARARRAGRAGERRRDPRGAGRPLGGAAGARGAGRGRRARRSALRPLPTRFRRARRGGALRRELHRGRPLPLSPDPPHFPLRRGPMMTWIWIVFGALASVAGLRHRARLRSARRPGPPPPVDDAALRRILEVGSLPAGEEEDPLDPEEAARAEEEFWRDSWDEPEEFPR